MKVSIIIAVLDSREVLRRQLLHFEKMPLPDDVELIILDDGSDPPLQATVDIPNLTIHPTHDTRPWSVGVARNTGAKLAKGEYYLMTDIDYVISRDAIEAARRFTGDKMRFRRQFGVLDENGDFTQDINVLRQYGLSNDRIVERGVNLPPHPNNFCMRRDVYWMLGGYDESKMNLPYPKCTDDGGFKRRWTKALEAGKVREHDERPLLYMFPSGQFCGSGIRDGDVDSDPLGLFHKLTRKTETNYWYVHNANLSG